MKAPPGLETLLEYGIVQEVVRPLMSGKEAQVYVVMAGGVECVAKVYKEATQRTFRHRSSYTEGRRTRNTRDQRAINKSTRHGRQKDEDAWRSTEVDMIYRLRDAGVRVPQPINFVEGVLVMELVRDAEGHPAPRLGELTFSPGEARQVHQQLIREVVRMLCAGVVHGDLSDFNVLMSHDGPVVIDFPQSVDPARNPNSQELLLRDVANLHRFVSRFAPDEPVMPYGEEMWSLFQANRLDPDTKLTGVFEAPSGPADTEEVMALIADAAREAQRRRGREEPDEEDGFDASMTPRTRAPAPLRRVVDLSSEIKRTPATRKAVQKTTGKAERRASVAGSKAVEGGGRARRRRPAGRRRPGAAPSAAASAARAPVADSVARNDAAPDRGRSGRVDQTRSDSARPNPRRAPQAEATDAGEGTRSSRPRRRRRRRARKPSASE